ncbi:MAG: type II secretion system F family protein [Syntrophomonadaceae bacterium]|nr:type II secretion system F family protein [Syntrophomonadaceae bacterium]
MLRLITCLIFGVAIYYLIYAGLLTFSRRGRYQDRLESLLNDEPNSDKAASLDHKQVAQFIAVNISKLFATQSVRERIQQQLLQAGIPLRAEEYISFCFGLILILPIIIYLLSHNFWLAIVAVVIGSLLPGWYVNHQKVLRLQTLNQQLGDALVIMANALRAGFGFQQAMDSVRKELPPPISFEFAWTLREMNLGFSTEAALENLSKRVPSDDLDMVVTGIIIQRQVGGDLARILDNISATIRERARIKREVRVLTAQGRMSGMLIGLLPVFLIAALLVINPSYFAIMLQDSRGIMMLAVAVTMEVIGFLVIKRLTQIDF